MLLSHTKSKKDIDQWVVVQNRAEKTQDLRGAHAPHSHPAHGIARQ